MPKSFSSIVRATLVAGMFAGLAACQATGGQQDVAEPQLPASPSAVEIAQPPASGMDLDAQLSFAIHDLAGRLGTEPGSIRVLFARRVTWRSGALGCPAPDASYTQAAVPGVWIMLESDDGRYAYHAEKAGKPFHCPIGRVQRPAWVEKEDLA